MNPSGLFQFSQRRNALAFWTGSAVVSIGVVLHLPMFWMARSSGFNMSGMPMDAGMLLIVLGIAAAGYGLLPNNAAAAGVCHTITPPEDARGGRGGDLDTCRSILGPRLDLRP
jgi:MFS transporter, putative metabolite:H+ symporter